MPLEAEMGRAFRRPIGEWRRPVSRRARDHGRLDRWCCRRHPRVSRPDRGVRSLPGPASPGTSTAVEPTVPTAFTFTPQPAHLI